MKYMEECETRLASECYLPFGLCRADNIPSTINGKPSLSVGSWHCAARAHRVELADDAITVAINPTCCDAAALSMSKKFSAQGNNYSGKFSKVSCQ